MNAPVDLLALRDSLPGGSRARWRQHTFLLGVVLPTLLVLFYMALIAPPQYVAGFRYSIYSVAGSNTNAELALTASTPAKLFDFVVEDYVLGKQAVADLQTRVRLVNMLHPPGRDFFFRFWWDDGSLERLAYYWRNWVIDAHFDTYSSIGSVEVRAFTPQDAQKVAQTLMELAEGVVNDLDQKSREDSVVAVQEEVARADARLQEALKKIEAFREQQRMYTPGKPADSAESLAATLRQELATMNTQQATLSRTLSASAPAIVSLKAQIAATEQELDRVLATLGADGARVGVGAGAGLNIARGGLPVALGSFDYLEAERSFAAGARETALKHLEQVQFNAKVQHLYLHAHEKPLLPKRASYPRTLAWTAMTFIALTVCWMIGTLLFFAMRDHMR
jgi:capsular polysaccharide transport system permease protein